MLGNGCQCLQPWAHSAASLEVFAGYVRARVTFASPAVYWWAIMESTDKGHHVPFDKRWA